MYQDIPCVSTMSEIVSVKDNTDTLILITQYHRFSFFKLEQQYDIESPCRRKIAEMML